ncbi:hypothetical protein [Chryseobacterium sp. 3008163]|uniref:hypothetical protein n=1 Tax=Chryseobacterium sp. 3008163 TaxID=2478663 RepID=UPI000F0CFBE2|nr:hypothetical protein [Chryseobacterium sp. 3008163]AYN02539.1 hypothetical protein EAG08_00960 [Chryseobacterium sp. 3008163]
MKITMALLFIWSLFSYNITSEKENGNKENIIISKFKHKKNASESDILWISQNDSTVFKKEEMMIHRPCSNPEFTIHYELLKPIDQAYYYIYNDKQQLISEEKYSKEYTYDGQTSKVGNFYNEKSYYYKRNGNLKTIHYMKDGRNDKVELYDNKKRLTEITYFDKKSSDKEKVEIYDKGKIEETRIYKSFDTYNTVKAN